GGLAGAVGADEAVHLTFPDGHAHVGQRLQAAEALGNTFDLEHDLAHSVPPSFGEGAAPLPCSGGGHSPRGRVSMMPIIASAISSCRRMAASSRPSVMRCRSPAT